MKNYVFAIFLGTLVFAQPGFAIETLVLKTPRGVRRQRHRPYATGCIERIGSRGRSGPKLQFNGTTFRNIGHFGPQ